ncbi:MAG TPA: hypothetical protein VF484_08000 [Candidatus Limnocylindrales bacterium]
MATMQPDRLEHIVHEALTIGDVQSAALFAVAASGALELAAAAGIEGAPLAGLVAAVQQPMHPVARAVTDPGPTFDVRPMNPGGPALRAHLPLRAAGDSARTLGVLALAYDQPFAAVERQRAIEAAAAAARVLASDGAGS